MVTVETSAPETTAPDDMNDELILENFLPYRLSVVSHTVSTTIGSIYAKRFGLSIPEWRVIAIVGRFPGLSAAEVAERTLMDKVAVSRAVTKLIRNGRIDRQFAAADRRRSILNLSEEGRDVHDAVATLALAFERDLLQGIDDKTYADFNLVLDRLLEKARRLDAKSE
jgi:DNA-binding MarR family transcriptional regulator